MFRELGGFDELYLPAYCEDSDLAFRVRAHGLQVYYTPFSTAVSYTHLDVYKRQGLVPLRDRFEQAEVLYADALDGFAQLQREGRDARIEVDSRLREADSEVRSRGELSRKRDGELGSLGQQHVALQEEYADRTRWALLLDEEAQQLRKEKQRLHAELQGTCLLYTSRCV